MLWIATTTPIIIDMTVLMITYIAAGKLLIIFSGSVLIVLMGSVLIVLMGSV